MDFKSNETVLRDKKITIKTTEKEREEIHKIAKRLGYSSTSKYMLEVAKNPVVFIEQMDQFQEINTNVSRIGTNINQIARKVNSNEYVMYDDLQEIMNNQYQLQAYLKLIKEFYFFEKSNLKEMFQYGDNEDSSH